MAILLHQAPSTRAVEKRLNRVYRKLSIALESAEERLLGPDLTPRERICLAIIDEDIDALLAECEELIVSPHAPAREHIQSFESRTYCVLEELTPFTRPLLRAVPSHGIRPHRPHHPR